jgi:hypothetical protein
MRRILAIVTLLIASLSLAAPAVAQDKAPKKVEGFFHREPTVPKAKYDEAMEANFDLMESILEGAEREKAIAADNARLEKRNKALHDANKTLSRSVREYVADMFRRGKEFNLLKFERDGLLDRKARDGDRIRDLKAEVVKLGDAIFARDEANYRLRREVERLKAELAKAKADRCKCPKACDKPAPAPLPPNPVVRPNPYPIPPAPACVVAPHCGFHPARFAVRVVTFPFRLFCR